MFPLVTGLLLGKRKKLSNNESMKASMLSYVGSTVGGNIGPVLSTMTAIDKEALENQLADSNNAKNRAETDINMLLSKGKIERDRYIIDIDDQIKDILQRHGKLPASSVTSSNGAVVSVNLTLDELRDELRDLINRAGSSGGSGSSTKTKSTGGGGGSGGSTKTKSTSGGSGGSTGPTP